MLRASRTSLAVIASLTLAVQLAGLAHEALAVHAVCAEHGDWIDQEPGAETVGHIDGVDLLTRGGAVAFETNGHEHCAVIAHRRAPARASGQALAAPLATFHTRPAPAGRSFTLGGLAPLDVAPKASPPARS